MKSLKDYSSFLKKNYLKEITKENLEMAIKMNIPLVESFKDLDEKSLLEIIEKSILKLLTGFEEGKPFEDIWENISKWEKGELTDINRENVSGFDIIKFNTIQNQLIVKYLPKYTQDINEGFAIEAEIRNYYFKVQDIAFNSLFNIRKEIELKLKETVAALTFTTEELQRSNRELSQFAYMASHDLQEPLRMISSYLQLLERRYKDQLDNTATEFIEFAVDGTKRMRNLIDDLLEYSRVGSRNSNFINCDINEVIEGVIKNLDPLIKDSNATINFPKMPIIIADPGQMSQVFQNLIGNGLKFKSERKPVININFKKENQEYLFTVQDNGIGIEKEYYERIFLIFQRLHSREEYSGTGIGLAIVKKIIDKHGGHIWVESKINKGSTFFFTIKKDLLPQKD